MSNKNSIFACFDAMFTQKVTWSPWLPFMISFFHWAWHRSWIVKSSQKWRWKYVQPLCVHAIQNTRATIVHKASSRQWNINLALNELWIDMLLLKFTCKVWCQSEKAFSLWSEWHYTTWGLVYEYIITRATRWWLCIHPPISLVV